MAHTQDPTPAPRPRPSLFRRAATALTNGRPESGPLTRDQSDHAQPSEPAQQAAPAEQSRPTQAADRASQSEQTAPGGRGEASWGRAVVPVRAIGVAGDQTRIAPAVFGARELAWSPHPDRSFDPGEPPASRPA